jgi:ATP-dependent RNA helicase DeaD
VGYGPQITALRQGAHVVVGTPGRILDHLIRGTLSLEGLQMLIFDEADRMLSMGFYPDMKEIQSYLPDAPSRTHVFGDVSGIGHSDRPRLHPPAEFTLSGVRSMSHIEHLFYTMPGGQGSRARPYH